MTQQFYDYPKKNKTVNSYKDLYMNVHAYPK